MSESTPIVTPTPASPPNNGDRYDAYSVHVKNEFVLNQRPESLPPLRAEAVVEPNKKERTKKKKRARDAFIKPADKLCLTIVRGDDCPFGSNCKFSHDLKAFVATREPGIDASVVEGGCPIYRLTGKCRYGAMCLLAESHVNMATGENLIMNPLPPNPPPPLLNVVSKEVLIQLRKKKYPFQNKRYNEQQQQQQSNDSRNNNGDKKEDAAMETTNAAAAQADSRTEAKVKQEVKPEVAKPSSDSAEVKQEVEPEVSPSSDSAEVKQDVKPEVAPSSDPAAKPEDNAMETSNSTEAQAEPGTEAGAGCVKPSSDSAVKQDPDPPRTESTPPAVGPVPSLSPLPTKERKLIDFANKVYIAPLTTVGNLPFRRIMKQFGADITCGEMALGVNLIQGLPAEWALLKRHADEDVFGVQIAAGYPDQFARVTELIRDQAPHVDFVDLNLGCPLDMVCDKGAGAKLMSKDKQLHQSLRKITGILADTCPVTVKMRTGWDMAKPFAHDLVRKIQSWNIAGVGAVMIHGRSRLQRYSKEANWDYIQQVATNQAAVEDGNLTKIPVIGNGDIFSYTDYETKVLSKPELTPCAMLARGALIKPWLPTEIKERRHWDISSSERLDFLKQFVKFGLEHWGSDQQGVNNTRRFLLEWLSFLHRYVPVGLLEVLPQQMNQRPPTFVCGRDDLETLMLSPHSSDWIQLCEMLLGPVPSDFRFEPKHQARGYAAATRTTPS